MALMATLSSDGNQTEGKECGGWISEL